MTGLQLNRKGWTVAAALMISAACYAETEYKPERYNVILDRSPFGSDPLSTVSTPDPNVLAQANAAKLEQAYRLSFLLETDDGEIRAGFQNLKPKPGEPLGSVIMVGESFMGMKLKSVDLASSEAMLEHNGQPIIFQLTQQASATVVPAAPTQPSRRFGGGFRSREPTKPAAPPEPKLSPAEQELRRAEIRKNLQDYQMEVIRTGMPPLPVPLTQEMDDQLVSEGVLPPSQ